MKVSQNNKIIKKIELVKFTIQIILSFIFVQLDRTKIDSIYFPRYIFLHHCISVF